MINKKDKLLSIGEISKLTGASIYSLRYYEKLNILKPAYVDDESSYRYYTFDQINHIWMIMFCVELDIPLKEFAMFTDDENNMDFRTFLGHGKEIAEEKLKALKGGLKLINSIEEQMDLADSYKKGQLYTRDFPEKYYYTKTCGDSISDIDLLKIFDSFSDMPREEWNYGDMSTYGILCEYTSSGTSYHAFVEVPKSAARMEKKNIRKIPSGIYICRQSDESQFEKIPELFKEYLACRDSFLAIETEIFTGKHKINKPLTEIRVISV